MDNDHGQPPPAEDETSTPGLFHTKTLGAALLSRARNAIAAEFDIPPQVEPDHSALHEPGATFVTLTQQGQLRGCIGSLEARRTLAEDVKANARHAAFHDPRFAPISEEEFHRTRIEVSLLAPAEPLLFRDEADAIHQLRPGVDGMIFECRGRRGTFLPQVWESLPERREFFTHLKQKAGFAPDFWSPEVKLYRYVVQKWAGPSADER
jgi:AmmeMemoRadiSam system protein A